MSHRYVTLTRQLEQQQSRFIALSPINRPQVHIRFPGHFQGHEVIWDARLVTLQSLYEQQKAHGRLTHKQSITLRQYIHIHTGQEDLVPVTIALNVPQFDEPTILKTIIMIHNYRRLQLGHHQYGEPVTFPDGFNITG